MSKLSNGTASKGELLETDPGVQVLGAILLTGRAAISKVCGMLAEEYFPDARHRIIYRAMLDLHDAGVAVESVSLTNHLRQTGQLERVGGPVYVADLLDASATGEHVVQHASILLGAHRRRAMRDKLKGIVNDLGNGGSLAGAFVGIDELQILRREIGSPTRSTARLWSHGELLQADMHPPSWLLEGLVLDEGLIALAGKKKHGKSWLALQLAQGVASGGRVLDRVAIQGPVLYIALEDGERRIRDRLLKQHAYEELPITYRFSLATLDPASGLKELEKLVEQGKPRLVVIDTLAAALTRKVDQNKAGDMAEIYNGLRDLAHKYHCCILLVAHHGKSTRSDPGDDIRGSSAQGGGVDLSLGLYKENGVSILRGEGRDIADFELRVEFDASHTWSWHLVGDHRKLVRDECDDEIVSAVEKLGGLVPIKAIAAHLEKPREWVQKRLPGLVSRGRLQKEPDPSSKQNRLLYRIPDRQDHEECPR